MGGPWAEDPSYFDEWVLNWLEETAGYSWERLEELQFEEGKTPWEIAEYLFPYTWWKLAEEATTSYYERLIR